MIQAAVKTPPPLGTTMLVWGDAGLGRTLLQQRFPQGFRPAVYGWLAGEPAQLTSSPFQRALGIGARPHVQRRKPVETGWEQGFGGVT